MMNYLVIPGWQNHGDRIWYGNYWNPNCVSIMLYLPSTIYLYLLHFVIGGCCRIKQKSGRKNPSSSLERDGYICKVSSCCKSISYYSYKPESLRRCWLLSRSKHTKRILIKDKQFITCIDRLKSSKTRTQIKSIVKATR